jgi:hypothetical protein
MNATTKILKRWRTLDALLRSGLNPSGVAKQMQVSERTIRRDIAAFRSLGQKVCSYRLEDGEYLFQYPNSVYPLFTTNNVWYEKMKREERDKLAQRKGPARSEPEGA